MNESFVESVLKRIIEIDEQTDETIEQLQAEIKDREKKLKDITRNIEKNSNQLQIEQGRKLYDLILAEANEEKEAREKASEEKLKTMDQLYEESKMDLVERAFKKLSLV